MDNIKVKSVTLISNKGGSTKTTSLLSLYHSFVKIGYSPVILDLDLNSAASGTADSLRTHGINMQCFTVEEAGSFTRLVDSDEEMNAPLFDWEAIYNSAAEKGCDFVLIDLPGNFIDKIENPTLAEAVREFFKERARNLKLIPQGISENFIDTAGGELLDSSIRALYGIEAENTKISDVLYFFVKNDGKGPLRRIRAKEDIATIIKEYVEKIATLERKTKQTQKDIITKIALEGYIVNLEIVAKNYYFTNPVPMYSNIDILGFVSGLHTSPAYYSLAHTIVKLFKLK